MLAARANGPGPLPEVRALPSAFGVDLALQGPRGWISLHSRRDPQAEATRWLESIFPDALPEALAIIGLGAGHVLDAVEARSPATRILAMEPVPDLHTALRVTRDLDPWLASRRLRVVVGPTYDAAGDAREALGLTTVPPVIVHPVLARELKPAVGAARMAVAGAFYGTPSDPRPSRVSLSMLPNQVLVLLEHIASTITGPIVEIGPYVGGSTLAFCRGLRLAARRDVPLISVEGGGSHPTHPSLPTADILADLRANLSRAGVDHMVQIVHGWSNSPEVIAEVIERLDGRPIALLFIDANGEVQRDFDNYLPYCAPGCVLVIDDYDGGSDKNTTTRDAVHRALAAGLIRQTGVAGTGTWFGTTPTMTGTPS
ncbi:MAG: class I SAM-dependent methyltransferase [Vicinamibacterales bacterium]